MPTGYPLTTPRVRQAVLAAWELDDVAARLRAELGLGEPYADPGVEYFGLRNAVFALGDTFLEVVSPVREDAAVARLLRRRGDVSGYMVMVQVDDLAAARERARAAGVREVFEVSLEDIEEVHLHPSDMRGAIVSLSRPRPPEAWRWGGPRWAQRSAPMRITGVRVAVRDPPAVSARWSEVLGALPGIEFGFDGADAGLVEIVIETAGEKREPLEIGGVRLLVVRGPPRRTNH